MGHPLLAAWLVGWAKSPESTTAVSSRAAHLFAQLRRAVVKALALDGETYEAMSRAALDVSFPLEAWRAELCRQYDDVAGVSVMPPNPPARLAAKSAPDTAEELSPRLDMDVLNLQVRQKAMQVVTLGEGRMHVWGPERILEHAYQRARCTAPIALSWLSAVLELEVLQCPVRHLCLCCLTALVPVSALVLSAAVVMHRPDVGLWGGAGVYSLHCLCAGLGSVGWLRLLRRWPGHIFGLAGSAQLTFAGALLLVTRSGTPAALVLPAVALHGLAAGAVDPVLAGLNFLGKWSEHTAVVVRRAAMTEPVRLAVTFALLGVIVESAPRGTSVSTTSAMRHVKLPMTACVITCATLALTVICWYTPLPASYRLPRQRLAHVLHYPVYCGLVAAQCVQEPGGFLSVLLIHWLLLGAFPPAEVGQFFSCVAVAVGLSALAVCAALIRAAGAALPTVAVITVFTFPPATLALVAAASAAQAGSVAVKVSLGIAITLGAVRDMATAILVRRVLPSRWKFIHFQSHAALLTHIFGALSPVVFWGAGGLGLHDANSVSDASVQGLFALLFVLSAVQCGVLIALLRPLRTEGILSFVFGPAHPGGTGPHRSRVDGCCKRIAMCIRGVYPRAYVAQSEDDHGPQALMSSDVLSSDVEMGAKSVRPERDDLPVRPERDDLPVRPERDDLPVGCAGSRDVLPSVESSSSSIDTLGYVPPYSSSSLSPSPPTISSCPLPPSLVPVE